MTPINKCTVLCRIVFYSRRKVAFLSSNLKERRLSEYLWRIWSLSLLGVNLSVVLSLLNMGLIEISMLITQFYVLGCCKLFGWFFVYLRGDSFSQRIGKIRRNEKFCRFLSFKIRIWSWKISTRTPSLLPTLLQERCVTTLKTLA